MQQMFLGTRQCFRSSSGSRCHSARSGGLRRLRGRGTTCTHAQNTLWQTASEFTVQTSELASPGLSFTTGYKVLRGEACKIGEEAFTDPGSSAVFPERPPAS